jgi:hypothetical protein
VVLTRGDFAFSPALEPRPSDKIAKSVWASIVRLPDDTAYRTSNHHGSALAQLDDLWGAWVESSGDVDDCLFSAMLDAADDFQSASYCALTGYYRLSVAAVRSALELTAIGTWAQICGKRAQYRMWREGGITLSFGQACDGLIAKPDNLARYLKKTVNDSLFDQKTQTSQGGFARRIFDGLSNFSHARPGYSDGDMRASNGPIYVPSVFNHAAWLQFETIGLCFVLLLMARPETAIPEPGVRLFNDLGRVKSSVTRAAFNFLYHESK